MSKLKSSLKYFRLTLFFAFIVFMIMLATMCLMFLGTHLLAHIGLIEVGDVEKPLLFLFCIVSILVGTVLSIICLLYTSPSPRDCS